MQIALGRRGDYAVRATLALARANGGLRKSREIAEEMDIPSAFLPQVMSPLLRDGIVLSVAGPSGGYALARPADQISLLDVVQSAEGPVQRSDCILRGGPCDWSTMCAAHEAWSSAQEALAAELAGAGFDEIARIDELIERGTYTPSDAAPPHAMPTSRRGQRPPRSP